MKSSISTAIKKRDKPNDVFITPLELAKKHIKIICDINEGHPAEKIYRWYDPFKNDGSYYNQFPHENKVWSEILEGRDFFEEDEGLEVNIICSNPPYSMMDKVLAHSVSFKPQVISYLIGVNNLTAKRIEFMEANGYYIKHMHMCKVFKWYGMSFITTWIKQTGDNKEGILKYDRKVWK